MIQVLFVVIAGVGLAAALGTILARNLVRAALYLVAFFFTVACHFVLLEAEFLAALQVLVYIGAVAIILMFGIMLTRNIQGDDPSSTPSAWRLPGLVAGLGVFLVLAFGITFQQGIDGDQSWADHERAARDRSGQTSLSAVAGRQRYGQERGRRVDDPLRDRLRDGGTAPDGRARRGDRDRSSRGSRAGAAEEPTGGTRVGFPDSSSVARRTGTGRELVIPSVSGSLISGPSPRRRSASRAVDGRTSVCCERLMRCTTIFR